MRCSSAALRSAALSAAAFACVCPAALAGKPPAPPAPPAPSGVLLFEQGNLVYETPADGSVKTAIPAPTAAAPSEVRHPAGGLRWWLAIEDADPTNADTRDCEIFAYGQNSGGVVRFQVTAVSSVYFFPFGTVPQWSGRTVDGVRVADAFMSARAVTGVVNGAATPEAENTVLRIWISADDLAAAAAAIALGVPYSPITPDSPLLEPLFRRSYHAGGYITDYAWSPDGRRVAFTNGIPNVTSEAVAVLEDTATSVDQRTVLASMYIANHPAWSPDGMRIAFDGISPDGRTQGIWVMSSTGAGRAVVATYRGPCRWSPEGTWIGVRAAVTSKNRTSTDLYRFPASGGTAVNLTSDFPDVGEFLGWVAGQ